jgi:hypothetical protein
MNKMGEILSGLIVYCLSLWGYILKENTKEEYNELKKKIEVVSELTLILSILLVFIFSFIYSKQIVFISCYCVLMIVFLKKYFNKKTEIRKQAFLFFQLVTYTLVFAFLFKTQWYFLLFLPMLSLITHHSIEKKWITHNEIIKIILVIIFLFLFTQLF